MAIQKSGRNTQLLSIKAGKAFTASVIIAFSFLISEQVIAQNDKKANSAIIVVGKPMSNMDSAMVKQVYFSALREKTVENFSLATELFNKVIQMDPANDAAMYELANLKKQKNNYEEAQQLLEKAITVNQDNEWYWLSLADCYEKSNDVSKLENVFNELIRINPDKPDYYYDKANVYFLQKRYDEALKVYDQLELIIGPDDDLLANRQKIYLKQGKVDLAAQQLDKMIDANPSQIKYYLFLSELYNANGFADKALKVLQTAEKISPDNGLVHLALADIYRDKKDYEASYDQLSFAFAIPDIDINQKIKIVLGYLPKFPDPDAKASALELSRILTVAHSNDARAYAIYGDMLLQNDKVTEAKAMYQKSISLNSQVYEVQEQLVRIELGSNDLDGAIKDGEYSLSLFPNQAWMNYLVGIAWLQKKDSHKALSYIKNATSLEFQDKDLLSQSYSSLGDCYHDLKDNKNSDDAYDKALSYNPDNVFTLNNYAYYLSVRGEHLDKAAAMSKHSNDLQPSNASFEDTYAWILFKQKDYATAKQWMEKALTDDKAISAVKLEHYGDILFYLGNIDDAVENWKKAKANGGKSPFLEQKINEKKYVE
ncbi:tetratricopeptide repeat protein [Mucilaginibacter frigoritolerans]|uniref:Tetratricopeptide repeat protein n=1 Tax=Mucilaginibacter frigoritolerans TaxID=652788 RepID=A0A562U1Z9_9SPHI|nr:tetratricopeptide repeat protein [Mucilaginibacter frigoritolerans]TWI99855.1 tetratricopeptide repeat protein [Mucilaginibacter frigoritolerans]